MGSLYIKPLLSEGGGVLKKNINIKIAVNKIVIDRAINGETETVEKIKNKKVKKILILQFLR